MRTTESQVNAEAIMAIRFFNDNRIITGNPLKRMPCAYGIAFRYMFAKRDLNLSKAAKKIGISSQSLNYIINRASEKTYNYFYVDNWCRLFNIDTEYFLSLVSAIKNIMES